MASAFEHHLGHSDPGFTLRAYTHLMPSSETRTREAIDRAFGYDPPARPGDGPDDAETGETAA